MLTVSMTVSHLYQNLKNIKVSEALNRLLKVLIIIITKYRWRILAPFTKETEEQSNRAASQKHQVNVGGDFCQPPATFDDLAIH